MDKNVALILLNDICLFFLTINICRWTRKFSFYQKKSRVSRDVITNFIVAIDNVTA